jgi:DNA-binding response OmpR family regulator
MTRKVLIVEDERELGLLLGEHLRRWGFEPTILNEGKNVVSWVQQNRPAVVLLDLMLPDLDGYTLCEALKLNRDTNLVPVVMVTALNHREDLLRGLEVGANRYLTKPFSSENLREAVYDAIAWHDSLLRNGTQGEVNFRLQSDAHHLEELNNMLGSLLLFSGLTQQQARQLTTAVRELGTNAIEWGHQKQTERIVTVNYRIDPQKVAIRIRDTGPGFDPKNLPHAADPEDPIAHMMVRETLGLREGGFGILMSRGLVDEMNYNEAGNEVELIKYFSPKDHLHPDESRQGACPTTS